MHNPFTDFLTEACESVDACVFSADYLETAEGRATLREYLARWQRALDTHTTEDEQRGNAQ